MEIEKLIVKYLVGCLSKEEDQILKNLKSATIIQYTIKGRFMSR